MMKIVQPEEKYLGEQVIVIRGNLSAFNIEKYQSHHLCFGYINPPKI